MAEQSTQSATGLAAGREAPAVERNKDYSDEETVHRSGGTSTPRRYDQPIEDDENPVMPESDSTLNTKI
jgi:hypothetical protein